MRSGRHPTGYYFLLRASQVAPDPDQPHSPPIQTSHTAHPSRPAANRKLSRIRFPNLTAPQAFGQLSTNLRATFAQRKTPESQRFRGASAEGEGFEPSVRIPAQRFSRPSHSAALSTFLYYVCTSELPAPASTNRTTQIHRATRSTAILVDAWPISRKHSQHVDNTGTTSLPHIAPPSSNATHLHDVAAIHLKPACQSATIPEATLSVRSNSRSYSIQCCGKIVDQILRML